MSMQEDADTKLQRAKELLQHPHWPAGSTDAEAARALVDDLKNLREFSLLTKMSERIVRMQPDATKVRRVHTQSLIETGQATAAIAVAHAALKGLSEDHPEWSELIGLIGRAYKQIAIDTGNPHCAESRNALEHALEAYGKPFQRDPGNTWHAINLVAVLTFAQRCGVSVSSAFDATELARRIIATINKKPVGQCDRWDAATMAEAHLALHDFDAVERHLHAYLSDPRVKAFEVGSTLRQFSEVWGLKEAPDPRSNGLLQALRARLLQLPGAQLRLTPDDVTLQRHQPAPTDAQLEAILGTAGTKSYAWWKLGLDRACSVVAIYAGVGQRVGTGFVVSARDLKIRDSDELFVLTNFHVVNENGTGGALRPDDAEIAIETIDTDRRYGIKDIVWTSPADRHDASLLRLNEMPAQVTAIPFTANLPVIEEAAKVYVIGHPGGGALEFSFQDNALLDHEGAPEAKPSTPGVCRLHYRAPTEKGSSGSPVFNASRWTGLALHHAGGLLSQLNGKPGTYQANEGISLASITEAIAGRDK